MASKTKKTVTGALAASRRQHALYKTLAAIWTLRLAFATPLERHVWRSLCTDEVGHFLGVQDVFEDLDDEPLRTFPVREAKRTLRNRLAELEGEPPELDATCLGRNIGWLARKLELPPAAQRVLAYVVLRRAVSIFSTALETLEFDCMVHRLDEALACMLGVPVTRLKAALSPDSALVQSGLVKPASSAAACFEDQLEIPHGLWDVLMRRHDNVDALLQSFFREASPAHLGEEDFGHLAADLGLIGNYLRKARRRKVRGINILLYGGPGVGKSEFARFVAKAIGHRLYEVACADDEGNSIKGQGRLSSFMLCQKMLASADDCIVLFDEIEDVFPSSASGFLALFTDDEDEDQSAAPGKAWINRLLETNPVPAIWISNSVDQIDPAYLRRFDYALEFPKPPKDVRRRIAHKYLAPAKASAGFIERIAASEALTPAQIAKAAKIARIAAESPAEAESLALRCLQGSARLLGQPLLTASAEALPDYELAYLNTSLPLAPLIAGLKCRPRASLCFYGAPGTGKTALARHLAECIGKPLLVRRASDLLSKWLGESEQNIARMFQDAREQDAVLALDEADSLLADRRGARQSWEVTQVNELLTQMEAFEGVFICTTNLLDRLDPASLRRFAFKVRFDCLRRDQRRQLFAAELRRLAPAAGAAEPGVLARLDRLEMLTPGDFAAVARQWAVMPAQPSAEHLIDALEEECRVKGNGGRPIGFTA